jgi:hypothetical protein
MLPRARFFSSVSLNAILIPLLMSLAALLSGCNGDGAGTPGPLIQVGDNLNFVPTNTFGCQDGFPVQINTTFPQPFTSQGATSCTLLTFFTGSQPSVPGIVESANINIGAVTGPMRFVKMRILLQNILTGPDRACCSVEAYGPVFTPQANAITTVPLNFVMTEDHVPAPSDLVSIAASDLVGLEVLAPSVPIPGVWVNNGGSVLTLPNYLWLPSMSARSPNAPTQNLRSEGSYSGFLPAYNLNFRATGQKTNPVAP